MKKNSIIKAIVLLIAVTLFALPVLSCGSSGCAKGTTEAPSDTTTPSEDIAGITLDMLKNYKIIVPESISTDLDSTSASLIQEIEKYTGVKLSLSDDFVKEGSDTFKVNEYEILLGKTNREESLSFHKTLKIKDYGYGIVGKKLIIAGHNITEISNSVSLFTFNILKNFTPDNEYVIKSDEDNIKLAKYDRDTLKIDGVDIFEYSIVYAYPCNKGENIIAEWVGKWITENFGYVLDIYRDSTEYNGGYEIQIGDTKRITDEMKSAKAAAGADDSKAYIQKHGNLIWLSGSNRTIIESSKSKLLELIKAQISENTAITLGASTVYNLKSQQLNVLNYNVRFDFETDKRNPDDVIVSIKQQSPDVFGVLEDTPAWLTKLKRAFDSEYTCVMGKPIDSSEDPLHNSIFYKTADFELIESGTKWMSSTPDRISKFSDSKHYKAFTYAILKSRDSGVQFMYVNTHLVNNDNNATSAAQDPNRRARVLQAGVMLSFISGYTDMPVIVAGDFNAGFRGEGPKQMTESRIFSNAYDIATESILTSGTFVLNTNSEGKQDAYTKRTDAVLDHIFVTAGSVTVQKFEAVDNIMNGKYPSDHLPVQAHVTLWQCE